TARSETVAMKFLTTLKLTSASSRAILISFMACLTSDSDRRPLPRSFLKVAASFSVKLSNAICLLLFELGGVFLDDMSDLVQGLVPVAAFVHHLEQAVCRLIDGVDLLAGLEVPADDVGFVLDLRH